MWRRWRLWEWRWEWSTWWLRSDKEASNQKREEDQSKPKKCHCCETNHRSETNSHNHRRAAEAESRWSWEVRVGPACVKQGLVFPDGHRSSIVLWNIGLGVRSPRNQSNHHLVSSRAGIVTSPRRWARQLLPKILVLPMTPWSSMVASLMTRKTMKSNELPHTRTQQNLKVGLEKKASESCVKISILVHDLINHRLDWHLAKPHQDHQIKFSCEVHQEGCSQRRSQMAS